MNKDFLIEKPKYIESLEKIIEYEEENPEPDHTFIEDEPYEAVWSSDDVRVNGTRLYHLFMNGFIDKVYDSNKHTDYSLIDKDKTKELVEQVKEEIGEGGTGIRENMHDFPDSEEELDGLFDDVIGYDDIKWLFKRAMTTDDITNILLVGPTGSAKTVFLMCVEKLGNAEFMSAKPTSGPGILDKMFNDTPQYMLIDEFDDMDPDVQDVLSQYTETGIVDETKVGKDRKMKTNTKTFASANEIDDIIQQIQDRFLDIHFDPYTEEEYIEVCEHILPKNEDVTTEEAREIAEGVWDIEEEGNVRKAIHVARLSRGDPQKVIEVLGDYSPSNSGLI